MFTFFCRYITTGMLVWLVVSFGRWLMSLIVSFAISAFELKTHSWLQYIVHSFIRSYFLEEPPEAPLRNGKNMQLGLRLTPSKSPQRDEKITIRVKACLLEEILEVRQRDGKNNN